MTAVGSIRCHAALAKARDDSTRITNVITGRPARGLVNRLIREQGPLVRDVGATELTRDLARQAAELMRALAS